MTSRHSKPPEGRGHADSLAGQRLRTTDFLVRRPAIWEGPTTAVQPPMRLARNPSAQMHTLVPSTRSPITLPRQAVRGTQTPFWPCGMWGD